MSEEGKAAAEYNVLSDLFPIGSTVEAVRENPDSKDEGERSPVTGQLLSGATTFSYDVIVVDVDDEAFSISYKTAKRGWPYVKFYKGSVVTQMLVDANKTLEESVEAA